MYKRKTEKVIRCPIDHVLTIIGGKWKSRIICVLANRGTLRFGQLCSELSNITDAVLSAALKELMADGIVERKQYEEIPLRVEYSLTQRGFSAVPVLQTIAAWTNAFTNEGEGELSPLCERCDYKDTVAGTGENYGRKE
ncbi:MAG TPA: helix-turn-helix domain-containing protein [Thermotogota bacterium]|nr:helix-turn-helix domain-containing protein [Thermotogota bacterium]HPJ89038.1 helix-turn-helix domain-containing protein [Thermotogota bacterium]HPR95148.1 helix-turn-helix domain-containing protein [Thermotogota bacterium]